jgi:hypothetical protein
MNLNTYNLSEDWGWYVDTESNLLINYNINMVYNKCNPYRDTPYKNINDSRLCRIEEEDEYEYYKNNYKDIENLELEYNYKTNGRKIQEKEEKLEKSENTNLYKIGSTTLITALLTYAIFFLI